MSNDHNMMEVVQQVRCYIEAPRKKKAADFDDLAAELHADTKAPISAKAAVKAPASAIEQPINAMIARIGLPYEGFRLIFDTETETDPQTGMRLRFGVYQIRGCSPDEKKAEAMRLVKLAELRPLTASDFLDARAPFDRLCEEGLFYRADTMQPEEIALLYEIAAERGMKILPWEDWLRDVLIGAREYWQLYWRHNEFHGLVIGHNLPFDISTVATREGFAKGQSYGGFSYGVCACKYATSHDVFCPDHPRIAIKQVMQGKNFIRWKPSKAALRQSRNKREKDFRRDFNIAQRHFIDTKMLARALLGPGNLSLEALTATLSCKTRKVRTDAHGGNLTREYVEYAINDVQATWEVYVQLRELYRRHGVSKKIWRIYSEASIGAAYLQDMAVPGFLKSHNLPKEVLAKWMETFYGGRSEVIMRLRPRGVIHCDFKSQYPTGNRLMRLQDLLLAETIEVRRNSPYTKQWLETVPLTDFQRKTVVDGCERWLAWEKLRGIALVLPQGDILPVRAPFAEGSYNIALPIIRESRVGPTWWTFADVIASRQQTGRSPVILETIELVPHGRIATKPLKLFGRDEYAIDLSKADVFTTLIDLRSEIKKEVDDLDEELKREMEAVTAEMRRAKEERRAYLDQLQLALKLLANATSYGKLVEFIVSEMDTERTCLAYLRDEVKELHSQRTEHPGSHFAPFGTLIPAAGRLLLAIAEKLAADEGISYVFCDTDSMCFARPSNLSWEEFEDGVNRVVDWFAAINPYRDKSKSRGSIFQIEHGAKERLRCLAVSAKRYALYRLGDPAKDEPRVVLVKISAHGLGAFWDPSGYVSQYSDAPPVEEIRKIVKTQGAPLLSYDLWREAIEAVEFERRDPPRERPWLRDYLYLDQAHVGTANVAKLYDAMPGLRSYIFFTTVPRMVRRDGGMFINGAVDDRKRHLLESGFYGPKADRVEDIRSALRFRDTGELANITEEDLKELEFQTIERKLSRYFEHEEATAWEPDGVGQLERRHVVITGRKSVGKESNVDDDDPDVLDDPRLHKELMVDNADDNVEPIFVGVSLRPLAKKTGIDPRTLARYRCGKTPMPQAVCQRIKEAIGDMQREAAPSMSQPKPARYKNMRNLTPSGKPSTKGDTLRLQIERLRPEPARSSVGRVAKEAGAPRYVIYNWYKRRVKLSPENEALIRETVKRLQAEDTQRAKVEAEEAAEAERLREEQRQRKREKGATRKRRARAAVSATS